MTLGLLGWGVVAGPFYVLVCLAQALTRDGFDLTRHQWSLLENGDLGWVQVANFGLTCLMLIAFAAGLRRSLDGGRWAPVLTGLFGTCLVAAGVFRADPALGFPSGPPTGSAPSLPTASATSPRRLLASSPSGSAALCWHANSRRKAPSGSRFSHGPLASSFWATVRRLRRG